MIKFKAIDEGIIECVIDLESVYADKDMKKFNSRWEEFLASDRTNASVIKRNE